MEIEILSEAEADTRAKLIDRYFTVSVGVRLIRRRGPTQGANVYFTFEILSSDSVES